MNKFNFVQTPIKGLYIVEPKVFEDDRGYFMETYNYQEFRQAGLEMVFIQDNQSESSKGVLRGLHFQQKHPQGKLVRAVSGEVFDVVVDIRKNSATFGKWLGIILSAENKKQLYIPTGFAHGFLVISDKAEFAYKCTDYYYPEDQYGVKWDDAILNIKWPSIGEKPFLLSEKDKNLPGFLSLKFE